MRLLKGFSAALFMAAAVILLTLAGSAQAATYSPASWIASLHFDGTDNGDAGESCFPIRGSSGRLINSYSVYCNYNGYSAIDVEDGSETYVPYKISGSAYGTSFEGYAISSPHPSNQRPATYWRQRNLSTTVCPQCGTYHTGWSVYEYWLYYAVNPTDYWLYPEHDQDWEKYYIYFLNNYATAVRLSNHHTFPTIDWVRLELDGLVEGVTHLKLSVEGEGGRTGSHAFIYDQYNPTCQDGVRIRYDGYITARGGRLDAGNGSVLAWTVFSNDPYAYGVTSYTLSPGTYYKGDPYINGNGEYSDGMPAPWGRVDWDNPPGPYCPWTL